MQRLQNPLPIWCDSRGALLDAGFVYVGVANEDPETDPIDVFLDQALTIPIAQPLRTLGGFIVSGENAVNIFYAETDCSVRVREADGDLVEYVPSTAVASVSYQPLDSDLTAIAALATTSYGRALLTLANQAALQAALGLPAALPLIGGTVTGNIVRSGAGAHSYHAAAAMTGARIYGPDPVGTADATSQPGDEQWFY